MNIAVIEDEKPHRDLLCHYLQQWRDKTGRPARLEAFGSAEAFWFRYQEQKDFDVLFIDIQMPGMNGMELARQIREGNRDIVLVFATGVSEYLEEGYEVEALHYLLKPLSQEKVEHCLEKALQRRPPRNFVTLHAGQETLKVSQECINYVEAWGRGCRIGRAGEQAVLEVKENLSELEGMLDGGEFMKCHRSFLCRISNIHHIAREDIIFDDGSAIPVSRRLYQQANKRFIVYFRKEV